MRRITRNVIASLLVLAMLFGCAQAENMESQTDASQNAEEELVVGDGVIPVPETKEPEEETSALDYYMDERLPGQLQQIILKNRERAFLTLTPELEETFNSYLTQDLSQEEDQRIAAILASCPSNYQEAAETAPDMLSAEQAEEDIRFLFDYLRYYYSGYTYFGDDAVFHPIRDDLIETAKAVGDELSNEAFEGLLVEVLLPVLADCHFHIGDTFFMDYYANQYFSVNEELLFDQVEGEYQAQLDGEAYRLVSVDGSIPELLPYLTAEGQIAWAVGRYHTEPETITVELVLAALESGEERPMELALQTADKKYLEELGDDIYHLRYEGEIPVVENRRLWSADDEERLQLEEMAAGGADVRDAPVVIVDLRNNGGGSDMYASQWTANYAGLDYEPYYNLLISMKYNRTVLTAATWMMEQGEYSEGDLSVIEPDFFNYLGDTPETISNENLVVVLTDQHVGSSGEGFVGILRQMENVLIVGTNTSGCKNFGDCNRIYLPNSHVEIYCGFKLFLMPDLVIDEGVGFMPDLWAPPGESLDRVLEFVERYGLAA